MTQTVIAERLANALALQRDYLKAYEKPSEPVVYETLRTLDDLFCRDLMEPDRRAPKDERIFRSLSTWGVDYALSRIVPRTPSVQPFRNFPSGEPVPLVSLLLETLVTAADHRGRAVAALKTLT